MTAKQEKRNHHRVKPKGLLAAVVLNPSSQDEVELSADILDISYSGIRVKLHAPIDGIVAEKLIINMILPETGAPFSVHGILKHRPTATECGLHYADHVEGSIDDLMFECVELEDNTVLIKPI